MCSSVRCENFIMHVCVWFFVNAAQISRHAVGACCSYCICCFQRFKVAHSCCLAWILVSFAQLLSCLDSGLLLGPTKHGLGVAGCVVNLKLDFLRTIRSKTFCPAIQQVPEDPRGVYVCKPSGYPTEDRTLGAMNQRISKIVLPQQFYATEPPKWVMQWFLDRLEILWPFSEYGLGFRWRYSGRDRGQCGCGVQDGCCWRLGTWDGRWVSLAEILQ